MGCQTGNDGMSGRGRVTTLTSRQSETLHSLIFVQFVTAINGQSFLFSLQIFS